MAKGIGRIAGILGWIVGGAVGLLLAASFVPTLFGLESMVVVSGSMGRAMPVGSVALTREVDARSVSVGDIVSFRRRGAVETTTHRVTAVKIQGSQVLFTTKGDANATIDPETAVFDGRVHRVEHVVPFAGYIVRDARSPYGAVGLFFVPIVGLSLDRRRHKSRSHSAADEPGWSATTLSLLRVAPEALRKRPAG